MARPNLNSLSDDQLMKIIEDGDIPESTGGPDLSNFSDEELMRLADMPSKPKDDSVVPSQYRGMVKGALNALPTAGMMFGGVAGTPLGPIGAVGGAGLGAGLGESIKQLGERYLLKEEKKPGQVAKSVAASIPEGIAAEMGGQILGRGAKLASESKAGKYIGEKISKGLSKVGEALTGISEKEIRTFANNADEISRMSKSSDNNTLEAADQIRQKFQSAIQNTRKSINAGLSNALESSPAKISVNGIIQSLQDAKKTINPKLYPKAISEIDDIISKISSVADDTGFMSAKSANEVKAFLQDTASAAYRDPAIFAQGGQIAKAAKAAAANARQALNKAVPDVANANNQLAKLHDIEDNMIKNLIIPGKPESALLSAGSGGNARNIKSLKQLGQMTGTNMLLEAEKLAAMRSLGDPRIMPVDFTGKAAARIGAAAGIGGAAAGIPGALAAGVLTSPATIKQAIRAGILTKEILANPTVRQQMSRPLFDYAQQLLNQESGPIERRKQQLEQGR